MVVDCIEDDKEQDGDDGGDDDDDDDCDGDDDGNDSATPGTSGSSSGGGGGGGGGGGPATVRVLINAVQYTRRRGLTAKQTWPWQEQALHHLMRLPCTMHAWGIRRL